MLGQGLRYRGPVATYGSDRTLSQASSRSYTTGLDLTERRGSLRVRRCKTFSNAITLKIFTVTILLNIPNKFFGESSFDGLAFHVKICKNLIVFNIL